MSLKERLETARKKQPEDLKRKFGKLAEEHKALIGGAVAAGAFTIVGAIILFKYLEEKQNVRLIDRFTSFLHEHLGRKTPRQTLRKLTIDLKEDPTVDTLHNLAVYEATTRMAESLQENYEGRGILQLLKETHDKITQEFGFPPGVTPADYMAVPAAAIGAFLKEFFSDKEED